MTTQVPGVEETLATYRLGLQLVLDALQTNDVPEVGMNVAYAPPGCRGPDDIAGLAGRIVIAGRTGRFAVAGAPEIGAPGHTGKIAWTLARLDPGPWWVLNHRHDDAFLNAARAGGLTLVEFLRADEPQEVSTMEWGTRHVVEQTKFVPDGVHDRGAWGKEPMIRLFARDAPALVRKLSILQTSTR